MKYQRKYKPAPWVLIRDRNKPVTVPKAKSIRAVAKARVPGLNAYRAEARAFVAAAIARGESCPVVATIPELRDGRKYGWPISAKLNEVHHKRGRSGKLLRDQRHWMAISKQGHRWVHEHPEEARRHGWLCPKGDWGRTEDL